VKEAGIGNAGLYDRESRNRTSTFVVSNRVDSSERFALQWVQKYITKFGGDPKKVTM